MILFPAIDLRQGQVVRLTQGDYAQMRVYSADPLQVAQGFKAADATHLHVVDLDGAKAGAPQNMQVIETLVRESGLALQVGGGLRNDETVDAVLALGAKRAILGTAALRDKPFLTRMLAQHGKRIAVGVDARDGKVAVEGWLQTTGMDAFAFCRELRDMGVHTVIYTDIARDGQLSGCNLDAYEALRQIDGLCVIASGGVSSIAEVKALAAMDLYGAILGKALYEGRLQLEDALQAASGDPT